MIIERKVPKYEPVTGHSFLYYQYKNKRLQPDNFCWLLLVSTQFILKIIIIAMIRFLRPTDGCTQECADSRHY